MRKKLVVVAALACIGVGTVGTGVAHASSYVLSDKINLTGTLVPGSVPGTFTFGTTTCSLTSDSETPLFPCQGSGGVTLAGTAASGKVTVGSADGSIHWKFSLVSASSTTYAMHGVGTERDSAEAGVVPPPYPAVMSGTVTIVGSTLTMTAKVKELPSQP